MITATKAVCTIVLLSSAMSERNRAPVDVLVAIGIHESNLKDSSRGVWGLDRRFHNLRCYSIRCQVAYAAKYLTHLVRKVGNVQRAIQLWGPNAPGYAYAVKRRVKEARKLIALCSES